MKGKLPEGKDEIAIDRMYADNNDLIIPDYQEAILLLYGRYERMAHFIHQT